MEPFTDIGNWTVVTVTLLVIAAAIGLHYEVLRACMRFLPQMSHRRRRRVLILIFVILITHSAEIWLFAIGYFFLLDFHMIGALAGTTPIVELVDYAYYSAMVYTTVGFGDVFPSGPIRFMTGMEALTGLVLITWSASFTFLEMQRDWPANQVR